MAFDKLSFDKTWMSDKDFPAYEPSETQVRKDFQYHPDAIKDFINDKLIPGVEAALGEKANNSNVITTDASEEFTPTEAAHPATKKYVDDTVLSRSYTKEESLSDETRELVGAAEGATPDAALAAVANIALGRAQIACGGYVGTGEYGADHPTALTFDFAPKVLFVGKQGCLALSTDQDGAPHPVEQMLVLNLDAASTASVCVQGSSNYVGTITFVEKGTTVSWYGNCYIDEALDETASCGAQLNQADTTYYYTAVG